MKIIKLLAAWNDFAVGTVLRVDETTADELITAKTAEAHDPEAEAKASEAQESLVKRIVSEVKEAITPEAKSEGGEPHVTKMHERSDDDPKRGFKHLGEFAASVIGAAKGVIDARLKAPSGLGEQIPGDGGFLVPEEFSSELLRNAYDRGLIYARARQFSTAATTLKIPRVAESSRADGSRQGGVRGYWGAEAGLMTASDPAFGQVELNLNKLHVFTYATDELLADARALQSLLGELAADEIAFKLDDGVMNGTGAGQPLGIMNSPCLVSVAKEANQPADTIVAENVMKMWSRLSPRGRGSAVWFVNQDTLPQLFSMSIAVGTGGIPVYMPANGLAGVPYGTMFGRPVIEVEQCDTVGDLGDIVLADMSKYVFATHAAGVNTAASIHLRFLYDETAFRWTIRADGQPWWASELTPKNSANTLSPFVALAARA